MTTSATSTSMDAAVGPSPSAGWRAAGGGAPSSATFETFCTLPAMATEGSGHWTWELGNDSGGGGGAGEGRMGEDSESDEQGACRTPVGDDASGDVGEAPSKKDSPSETTNNLPLEARTVRCMSAAPTLE